MNGLELLFDGNALFLKGGKVPGRYTAASGKAGRYDPIPIGTDYWINAEEIHQLEATDDLSTKLTWEAMNLFLTPAAELHRATGVEIWDFAKQFGIQQTGTSFLKHQAG